MAKNMKNDAGGRRESILPWSLLISRKGDVPALGEGAEAEGAEESRRPMTEKEGRGAFLLWMICGFVLCLLTAIFAVSCAQQAAVPHEEGGGSWIWTAALIVILAVIVGIAAIDFRKAWKKIKQAEESGKKTKQTRTAPLPPAAERGSAKRKSGN